MSAASFLHSSFLQAVNAVMLWLVRAEKVPQASEHLCPAKPLSTSALPNHIKSAVLLLSTPQPPSLSHRTVSITDPLFHWPVPPRWPSGKASASRAEETGFESRLRLDFLGGRVIPATQKLALQWLPCQAPGFIGSALELVGPVSVYCDWVR